MSGGTRKSPRMHLVSADGATVVSDESDEKKERKSRKTLAVEPTSKESKAYIEVIDFSVAIPRAESILLTFEALMQRYASNIVESESLEIESGASTNATLDSSLEVKLTANSVILVSSAYQGQRNTTKYNPLETLRLVQSTDHVNENVSSEENDDSSISKHSRDDDSYCVKNASAAILDFINARTSEKKKHYTKHYAAIFKNYTTASEEPHPPPSDPCSKNSKGSGKVTLL